MKIKKSIVALSAAATLLLTACGGSDDDGVIEVGAAPNPHARILQHVIDNLPEDAGFTLKISEYTDETRLNQYLHDGDIDANYFQHRPYFDAQVADNGYEITALPGVHIEPYALYSAKHENIADLPDGAKIAVTNDPVNFGRALDLLEYNGLLTVKDTGDNPPTVLDIESNSKNLEFIETDPAQLVRALPDVDGAIISGNYALEGDLSPTKDGLLVESGEGSPYANFLTIRTADVDREDLKALDALLRSDLVRDFIQQTWPDGEVIPAF